ncbi:MAG: HD domain-containing protein [Lachnospiraceae bacterium]|nr:HD domain-containing protein [Lachnospiraceae bacterium]
MDTHTRRIDKNSLYRALFTMLGIVLNVVPAFVAHRFDLPFYADTLGTVFVSALCGSFSGIVTAVLTSVICNFFNDLSIYFTLISILIALITSGFVRQERYRRKRNVIVLILVLSIVSGVMGTVFQWMLIGGLQFAYVSQAVDALAGQSAVGSFFAAVLISTLVNIVDKGVLTMIAVFMLMLIPTDIRDGIYNSSWRQKPLSLREISEIRGNRHGSGRSIASRLTITLTVGSILLVAGMMFLSVNMYSRSIIEQYSNVARNAAVATASALDTDLIDTFIRKGKSSPGYRDTERRLISIRENSYGVQYLYVVKVDEDGMTVVFDLDSEQVEGANPGTHWDFEPDLLPQLDRMLAGQELDAFEEHGQYGWVLTLYYPVRDDEGHTDCYVGVDLSLDSIREYITDFMIKAIMVFSGFFILILGFVLWMSNHYLAYPIGAMASMIDGFSLESVDQNILDDNVRKLRTLDIHTSDEVEVLYRAICEMASGGAEQMRSIRYLAESTSNLQNGLIITMADLVENRDSDTGAHIQKTAAYVRIIAEGLKAKGYYAEKMSPKFISDVVMSAPLHDVGKINISDTVLNKPGKLSDEEFEIMKTHTIHGRKIIEKAISTVSGESYLKEARNMAAYHHERWDGKGYPEGLHGQVIPLSARIMAVADVFDALVSPRVYKPAFPLEKALKILEEGAGTQFDPKCVEVFMEALPEVKHIMIKYQEG